MAPPVLDGHDPGAVEQAAHALAEGRLVALPTETVYGLGARADDDQAVAAIYAAKGRPPDHPLIVHVLGEAEALAFTPAFTPLARRLAQAFWPGPVTLILNRRPGVATAAAGGQDSIGLRCPAHPVARALLQAAARHGVPGVAAPSANLFGRISPTTAAHVVADFGDQVLVLDGGACQVGIESSIVDCRGEHPVLLRPGVLTREQIEHAAAQPLRERGADAPRSSGSLASHYAPRATLRLMDRATLAAALQVLGDDVPDVAVYSRGFSGAERDAGRGAGPDAVSVGGRLPQGLRRRMPSHPDDVARELFAVLRDFDAAGVRLIWVEAPPDDPAWEGVRDRLQRAATR